MKKRIGLRLIIASAGLLFLLLAKVQGALAFALYAALYLLVAYDMIIGMLKQIKSGQFLNENFLMIIATIGAFALLEYVEALEVVMLFRFGEMLEQRAVSKSRKSIQQLMDICPETAHWIRENGIEDVSPDALDIGSVLLVKKGEKIPVDGVLLSASCLLDMKALTGESLPKSVAKGEEVLSGSIVIGEAVKMQSTKSFDNSTAARILELVENAAEKKAKTERFLTKFAKYYTPSVVAAAVLVCLIPSLFLGGEFAVWLKRALVFLVVSCPCALVLSVPLTFFAGIGAATKKGILFKGGSSLEMLSSAKKMVFDKTGTLTVGMLSVKRVVSKSMDENELLQLAAQVENHSTHPVAKAIVSAGLGEADGAAADNSREIEGRGMTARLKGKDIAIGNARLMRELSVNGFDEEEQVHAAVYIAIDGEYAGRIELEDEIKPEARAAIQALRAGGIESFTLLSGDKKESAEAVAQSLGIDGCLSELLPEDKVKELEKLLAQKKNGENICFVGDGINDAPVIVRADVGIAMGGVGSDAAIEAADVVIMDDNLKSLGTALRLSKKGMSIARQNIVFSIGVKLVVMGLGVFGLAGMHMAVFADVGVALLAVLNAMRMLKTA